MSSPIGGEPGGEGSRDRQWLVSSIIIQNRDQLFGRHWTSLSKAFLLTSPECCCFGWRWEERRVLDVSKLYQLSFQLAVLSLQGKDENQNASEDSHTSQRKPSFKPKPRKEKGCYCLASSLPVLLSLLYQSNRLVCLSFSLFLFFLLFYPSLAVVAGESRQPRSAL